MVSLDKIIVNQPYKVMDIQSNPLIKRRFLDIGIVPSAKIEKVLVSPFGGISAYSIMGTTIAIRDQDAKGIMVSYEEI